ncbi:hypothetical protein DOU17_07985, partial [Clavibacter michiganensis subsp. michiganensis]|nr:hypothetical protein [Clavibacter michiganensis subsp. michiganensis]
TRHSAGAQDALHAREEAAQDALHAREEAAQRDALGTMDRVTARFSGEVSTGSAATPRDWWLRKLGVVLAGVGGLRSPGPGATDR